MVTLRVMRTALVLDIDGVVRPASGASPFGGLVEVGFEPRPVLVSAALCTALAELAAAPGIVPVWLTSWLPEVRRSMRPPFPGRDWPQLELLPTADPGGWPKWTALNAWLDATPGLTRLAWADDDLAAADRIPSYRDRLSARGLDTLLLAPDPADGLTPPHLAHLTSWLHPPPTP
ncbi:hypothetical protein GCM10009679_70380 [Saccharothrix algeriensis]|uniref:Uncharacterized protein n=1 Tax=Catellatospora bangladeshensis TaxID=310355 RepID=A0A8J3NMM5_9ACTN|nr:hypothetical protein Cba03nite_74740 [Catellatospora bangladeshensis]